MFLPITKLRDLVAHLGKPIRWVVVTDPVRLNGRRYQGGTLEDVRSKNVLVDGDWRWFPDMVSVEVAVAETMED